MPARNPVVELVRRTLKAEGANSRIDERAEHYTCFTFLPSATQGVTTDLQWDLTGTATIATATRPANGGFAITTQTTTPADGDTSMMVNLFPGDLDVNYQPTYEATVSLESTDGSGAQECFWYFGFRDTVTDVDPSGESDDAAGFFAQGVVETVANDTAGTALGIVNWYVHEAHGGTDTYYNTGIPWAFSTDVKLSVRIGTDLKARYYIDDVLVYTGTAFTSGEVFQGFGGVELTATPGGTGKYEVRYAKITQNFTPST